MKRLIYSTLMFVMSFMLFSVSADKYIYKATDLQNFRDEVNNGNTYSGQTVYLCADIDLGGASWTPIGDSNWVDDNGFQGTFDGQGHKIANFKVSISIRGTGTSADQSYPISGLFGLNRGVIKNLYVLGADIYANSKGLGNDSFAGAIAGINRGTINNCCVSNSTISAHDSYSYTTASNNACAGGITGCNYDSNFSVINSNVNENVSISATNTKGWSSVSAANTYTNRISNAWKGSNTQTNCCTSSSAYNDFRNGRNAAAWLNNNIPGSAADEPYTWDANGITPEKHFALNVTNDMAALGSYRSGAYAKSPTPGNDQTAYVYSSSVNVYPATYVDSDNKTVTYMLYPCESCNEKGTDVTIAIGLEGEGSDGHAVESIGGYNFVKRNGYYVSRAYLTDNYTWDNDSYTIVEDVAMPNPSTDKTDINTSTNRYLRSYELTLTSKAQPLTFVYETENRDEYEVFAGDMSAYQLLALTEAGKSALSTSAAYLTYNPTAGGNLYLVNADGTSTKLSGDALTAAWNVINNADAASLYAWTAKSWLAVELPQEYLGYPAATDASAKSVITTTNYNLNINDIALTVSPLADTTFGYVCESLVLGTNNFSVSMNYNQLVDGASVAKVSDAKSVALTIIAPNAKATGEVEFTVTLSADASEAGIAITDEAGNEYTADNVVYNTLAASFSFVAPNVDSSVTDAYKVVYVPTITIGGTQTTLDSYADSDLITAETLSANNVNPTADNIVFAVETRYYSKAAAFAYSDDASACVPASIGESVNVSAAIPQLSTSEPEVSANVAYIKNADETYNVLVRSAAATLTTKDYIGGTDLEDSYYDFDVQGSTTEISGLQNGSEENDFGVVMENVASIPESVVVKATPLYVFATNDSYVALRGAEGSTEIYSDMFVGVEAVFAEDVSVKSGTGYIEIIEAGENQLYTVDGVLVGANDSRYEVAPGVYIIKLGSIAIKVIVR